MGTYVNPNSRSMESAVSSKVYVDKTGLLKILNNSIGTENCHFAVSRARRFGKSMAAGMIDCYYSCGCDSKERFSPFEIAKDPDYEKHLNKYNVLHFDMATYYNRAKKPEDIIPMLDRALIKDMAEEFPFLNGSELTDAPDAVNEIYKRTGRQFVVIIDEYDCIIRDSPYNEELILDYLKYLRGFFKTEESKQFIALAYITGILPIKKIKGKSALNNFREYSMTEPGDLVEYFGFTKEEVGQICRDFGISLKSMEKWYDGYYMYAVSPNGKAVCGEEDADGSVRMVGEDAMRLWHIYNPNSVVEATLCGRFISYWKNTGSFESLQDFIMMNKAGLKDDIVAMLAGIKRPVDISSFSNDLSHFKTKDDVLSCLIHMGYLGYDAYTKEAFIPNREVAEVFESAVKTGDWDDIADALRNSDALLRAVWQLDGDKVAKAIALSHQDYSSIINFNDENSLALAIMVSFYTARQYYSIVREFPAGKGFADIVFIPREQSMSPVLKGPVPAVVVELKWNRSARAAIKQIKDRNYAGALSGYGGELILVGIYYTKKSKKYSCRIEKLDSL
ncbi:MAG: AAA family ATPase [Lachnospiraceae bacterium]|nr:AAA family ATPase [Lachnospiraceae bacterium]